MGTAVSRRKLLRRLQNSHGSALTPEWLDWKYHAGQHRLRTQTPRFVAVRAGRRSGKTRAAREHGAQRGMFLPPGTDGRIVFAAPVRQQAKDIFWEPLKRLIPGWAQVKTPSESELKIFLWNGATLQVAGLDKPQRIEGSPLDGIVVTEMANTKPDVLDANIMPMLMERGGWGWFESVPEGRNHFARLCREFEMSDDPDVGFFHWTSAEVMRLYLGKEKADAELARQRSRMDERIYAQEFDGEVIDFAGLIYYKYSDLNRRPGMPYYPDLPIVLALDFNVDPGIAVIMQEVNGATCAIDEIYIPTNSNSDKIATKFSRRYAQHRGDILLYGDATGGARGSAKVEGSDWDLIRKVLKPQFGRRLKMRVPKGNPPERSRVNAVNGRLQAADGVVRFYVNPDRCPHLVDDFESVRGVEGGSGEIDKDYDKRATHLTDAVGYYLERRWPVRDRKEKVEYAAA